MTLEQMNGQLQERANNIVNYHTVQMGFRLGYACATGHRAELTARDNTRGQLKFISRAASFIMIIVLVNMLVVIMSVRNKGTS